MRVVGQKVVGGKLLNWIKYQDGEYGGFVEDLRSVDDTSRVLDSAIVLKGAYVRHNSLVRGHSVIAPNSRIGSSTVRDSRVNGGSVSGSTLDCSTITRATIGNSKIFSCSLQEGTDVTRSNLHGVIVAAANVALMYSTVRNTQIAVEGLVFYWAVVADRSDWAVVGPALSSGRMALFYKGRGEIRASVGCFKGGIQELTEKAKITHAQNQGFLSWYLNAIKFAESVLTCSNS